MGATADEMTAAIDNPGAKVDDTTAALPARFGPQLGCGPWIKARQTAWTAWIKARQQLNHRCCLFSSAFVTWFYSLDEDDELCGERGKRETLKKVQFDGPP
eukprot:4481298-Pyramimonas_sp.AAC.1